MKEYFDIKIEELQSLGKWAADCAARALSIYEKVEPRDGRPRQAIAGARDFAISGKRTQHLRILALDAYRAALETKNTPASAAARSASLAAASAYTHPFRDINQSKHILGPAVYAAFALELSGGEDETTGDQEIELAIATATPEIAGLLGKMPGQKAGTKRLDRLFHALDAGIRKRCKFQEKKAPKPIRGGPKT